MKHSESDFKFEQKERKKERKKKNAIDDETKTKQ